MDNTRIFRSALNGKFYKMAEGANPEKNKPRGYEAAGIVTPAIISDIRAVVVLDEVLGYQRKAYGLRKGARPIPMDQLTFRIDVATKLVADEKVPPLVEANIDSSTYTNVDFDLWKNVVHVAMSDEAMKQAAHAIFGQHVSDAGGALASSENGQIATIIEAGTVSGAGADWGGANNPYDDLTAAADSIEGTYDHEPNHVMAHPRVWTDFFSNDDVKGQLDGVKMPAGKEFPIPGLPGWTGLADWGLTNTIALVQSKGQAYALGEGPTEAARYRDEKAGYDAYIIRQWLEPKMIQEGAMYRLTGVHA